MIDIQSPEALMARQLASQRTGFAIAGDGPMQSDLFPVLEYAAPRAFYLVTGSRMLDILTNAPASNFWQPMKKLPN